MVRFCVNSHIATISSDNRNDDDAPRHPVIREMHTKSHPLPLTYTRISSHSCPMLLHAIFMRKTNSWATRAPTDTHPIYFREHSSEHIETGPTRRHRHITIQPTAYSPPGHFSYHLPHKHTDKTSPSRPSRSKQLDPERDTYSQTHTHTRHPILANFALRSRLILLYASGCSI